MHAASGARLHMDYNLITKHKCLLSSVIYFVYTGDKTLSYLKGCQWRLGQLRNSRLIKFECAKPTALACKML